MSPTLSGPFLLIISLYLFVRIPDGLLNYIVFFAPFSATAIVNVAGVGAGGTLGVTPANLSLLLFFVAQLGYGLAFRPVKVSGGLIIQLGLIGCFVMVMLATTIGHSLYQPLTTFQKTQTIYVLLDFLAVQTFSLELCRDGRIDSIVATVKASAIFCSCWGLIQFASFVLHLPYPDFIFNNSLSDAADMFNQVGDGFLRIASVAVEPSFFASSMLHFVSFGMTVIIGEPRLRTRSWIFPVGFATFMLLLSTSSTAYFGLAILGILLLVRWPIASLLVGIPVASVFGILVASLPKLAAIIADMTLDKNQSSSYLDRSSGALEAYKVFLSHPLFGSGWSSVPNFSAITATLGNVGVIGAVMFLIAALATIFELQSRQVITRKGPDWRLSIYAAGVQHAMIVAFACAVGSGIKYVVLDDTIFWALGIAISSTMATSAGRSIFTISTSVAGRQLVTEN